jgi:hypothetical protein
MVAAAHQVVVEEPLMKELYALVFRYVASTPQPSGSNCALVHGRFGPGAPHVEVRASVNVGAQFVPGAPYVQFAEPLIPRMAG